MTNYDAEIIIGVFIGIILLLIHGAIVLIIYRKSKISNQKLAKSQYNADLLKLELKALEIQSHETNEINLKRFNYLRSIFSSIKNGLILLDNKAEILFMNPQAQEVFEVDDQVFFDTTLLMSNSLYLDISDMISQVKEKRTPITKSIAYKDHFYDIFVSKIFDKYSKEVPLGVLISIRDVTEQIKVENLRKDFVQNVSHEFRTPLTVISSYFETLKMWDDLESSYKQETFEIIEFEIDRLQKILNQLLNITTFDKQDNQETVSLTSLINKIIPSYSRVAEMNDVEIQVINRIKYDDTILVNRSLFLQAISNVLENAIKFTRPKTTIILEMSSSDDSLNISVQDQGFGLPKEDQSKIFERFYRVDKHRNSKTGGSGLGLAITKEVIESLGGSIAVESQLDIGSKFTIIMPKHKEKE